MGPQQGWKTQRQHDGAEDGGGGGGGEKRMEVEDGPGPPTGNGFKWLPGSLSSSRESLLVPSVSRPLSSLSPFSSISAFFFLTDALLTELAEPVLRMGCAARLTLLPSRSRCGSAQCVCARECVFRNPPSLSRHYLLLSLPLF